MRVVGCVAKDSAGGDLQALTARPFPDPFSRFLALSARPTCCDRQDMRDRVYLSRTKGLERRGTRVLM